MRQARLLRLKYLLVDDKPCAGKEEMGFILGDYEDYKFTVGEQFEMYYKKNEYHTPIVIEEVLDELIKVKYLSYNPSDTYNVQFQWIGTDSDKLQKLGMTSIQYKAKYIEYYETLHDQKMRAQQALLQSNQGGQMR